MEERRKERRAWVKHPAKFGVDFVTNTGQVIEVSLNGLRIATSDPVPPGSKITVEFTTTNPDRTLRAKGVVRWLNPVGTADSTHSAYQFGVELNWRDEAYVPYLSELISQNRDYTEEELAEKRRFIRYRQELEVVFEDENEIYTQISRNISKGGLFINTSKPLPKGTEVWLRIVIPQIMRDVRVKGLVVYSISMEMAKRQMQPPGVGVKLIEFADGDKDVFADYIMQLYYESKLADKDH